MNNIEIIKVRRHFKSYEYSLSEQVCAIIAGSNGRETFSMASDRHKVKPVHNVSECKRLITFS